MNSELLFSNEEVSKQYRLGRNKYWLALGKVARECQTGLWGPDIGDISVLETYLKDTYGIKMDFDGRMITGNYAIVDEEKYTLFLLKFM